MYEISEFLPVNTSCQDLLTGVRMSHNIIENEAKMVLSMYEDSEGFVGDDLYLIQEIALYR
jgi:hypothetical protein